MPAAEPNKDYSGNPFRIAQSIRLRRSATAEYKACHAAVWPAVVAQIKDSNIADYSIFLDEQDSILFASMKYVGKDFEGDMARMARNEEVQRWWKMTDGMQESFVEGSTGSLDPRGWWRELPEVFRLE